MSYISPRDFSAFSLDLRSGVVRPTVGDAANLRVVFYKQRPLLMTGTIKDPVFHDAEEIITGLINGSDEFELPLPEPVELILVDDFTPEEQVFLYEYALGASKDLLKITYGATFAELTTKKAEAREIVIRKASSALELIQMSREKVARASRELAARRLLQDGSPTNPDNIEPEEAPAAYGVITKASDKLYERLARRAGGYSAAGIRVSWPFKDMQVGDRVSIEPKLVKKAQTAVHVYAARVGKRFTTQTSAKDGSLLVLRIEDRGSF